MNENNERVQTFTLSPEDRLRRRRAIEEDTAAEDEARRAESLTRDYLRRASRTEMTP